MIQIKPHPQIPLLLDSRIADELDPLIVFTKFKDNQKSSVTHVVIYIQIPWKIHCYFIEL